LPNGAPCGLWWLLTSPPRRAAPAVGNLAGNPFNPCRNQDQCGIEPQQLALAPLRTFAAPLAGFVVKKPIKAFRFIFTAKNTMPAQRAQRMCRVEKVFEAAL